MFIVHASIEIDKTSWTFSILSIGIGQKMYVNPYLDGGQAGGGII